MASVPQLDKERIDDVIVGNATPEAEQGLNMGRMISLMGLDTDKVPGMTVNRYCASGLETIAIAKTSSQLDINNENISQLLRQRYTVRNTNLDKEISSDVALILLNGLEDSLTNDEHQNLQAFIDRGGNVLLAQNRIKTDLSTQQANPIESDIFTLLDSYGLHIEPNLVLDLNCGKVNVQQNLGFIRIPVPMDYPFLPIIKENNTILITTEKDYFRIDENYKRNMNYLKIAVDIKNRNQLIEEIKKII